MFYRLRQKYDLFEIKAKTYKLTMLQNRDFQENVKHRNEREKMQFLQCFFTTRLRLGEACSNNENVKVII